MTETGTGTEIAIVIETETGVVEAIVTVIGRGTVIATETDTVGVMMIPRERDTMRGTHTMILGRNEDTDSDIS